MSSRNKTRRQSRPTGITLVELLVVIFITLLVTAIAIPVMIPSVEQRRLRETSRVITSHMQGARTRAIQMDRKFGVQITPQAGQTGAGITLTYMVEAPPWQGNVPNSAARVFGNLPPEPYTDSNMNGSYDLGEPFTDTNGNAVRDGGRYALLDAFVDSASAPTYPVITEYWAGLIRQGDRIRLNFGGPWYTITSGEPYTDVNGNGQHDGGEPFVDLDGDTSYDPPILDPTKRFINGLPWTLTNPNPNGSIPSSGPAGMKFEVSRQPTSTAAHPLQLPNAMVVDLEWSGTTGLPSLAGLGPVTILFTQTGALESIYFYQNNLAQHIRPTGPVHLLIGKTEKVGNTLPNTRNYEDATNFWVTIHPQTGLITSTEVGGDLNTDGVVAFPAESRFFAERGMALGGR